MRWCLPNPNIDLACIMRTSSWSSSFSYMTLSEQPNIISRPQSNRLTVFPGHYCYQRLFPSTDLSASWRRWTSQGSAIIARPFRYRWIGIQVWSLCGKQLTLCHISNYYVTKLRIYTQGLSHETLSITSELCEVFHTVRCVALGSTPLGIGDYRGFWGCLAHTSEYSLQQFKFSVNKPPPLNRHVGRTSGSPSLI